VLWSDLNISNVTFDQLEGMSFHHSKVKLESSYFKGILLIDSYLSEILFIENVVLLSEITLI